jgi:hypothetical protein
LKVKATKALIKKLRKQIKDAKKKRPTKGSKSARSVIRKRSKLIKRVLKALRKVRGPNWFAKRNIKRNMRHHFDQLYETKLLLTSAKINAKSTAAQLTSFTASLKTSSV